METIIFGVAGVLLCGFLAVQSLMAFTILNAAIRELHRRFHSPMLGAVGLTGKIDRGVV